MKLTEILKSLKPAVAGGYITGPRAYKGGHRMDNENISENVTRAVNILDNILEDLNVEELKLTDSHIKESEEEYKNYISSAKTSILKAIKIAKQYRK